MLSLTRYRIPSDNDDAFAAQAHTALQVLATRPGFVAGRLARNLDEPGLLALITEWAQVGDYRRALGDPQVKMVVVPLLYQCVDEPSAYADVRTIAPGGQVIALETDLAGQSRGSTLG